MKLIALPLVCLFLLQLNLYSQSNQNLDSLVKAYQAQADDTLKVNTLVHLFNGYLYNDQIKAYEYAKEELELSQKLDFKNGIARANYHLGVYYNNIDKVDSAKVHYQNALVQFAEINDDRGMALTNHGMAILEYTLGNFDEALDILEKNTSIYKTQLKDSASLAITYDLKGSINTFLGNQRIALIETLKALKILNKIEEPIRKADVLNHLGAIEFYLDHYDQSVQYNQEALKIYEEFNDKYYQAQALNDLGNTFYYQKKYDMAIEFLNRSLVLSREMNSTDLISTSLTNLGKVYTDLDQPENAIPNLNKALALVEKSQSRNKIIESLNNLGRAYEKMGQPKKAIQIHSRAIAIADSIKSMDNLRLGYLRRSNAYESLNQFDLALKDYHEFNRISDTLYSKTKTQQIEELRTIHETEKKEQQIAIQEQEIDLLEQKAKVNNLQRILLGGGLGLSLLVFGFAFYGIRQKMKRNRLEKEKVDAELAFKKKELTTHALHLAKKNEVLEGLKQKATELKEKEVTKNGYQQLIRTINFDLQDDNNWENFSRYFEEVHKDFNSNVKSKYPQVTSNELRLLALLKMNLSSKEIANILNISPEGIKKARYRLRKKLDITTEDSLQDLVLAL